MNKKIVLHPWSLSIILPAYNEEENIEEAVADIQSFIKKHFLSYEIIVVNDGSTDQTKSIVASLLKKDMHIRLVSHKKNLGYGAALRSGFRAAKMQLVFYTDSDRQFAIHELDSLMTHIPSYDIVAGYRLNRKDPLMRIGIATVYNTIIRALLGLRVKDIDCSFKLYKREVFNAMSLYANTGLIDAEVLIKALKKGYRIKQVGVTHYPRRKGRTIYEVGNRNNIIAFVKPHVVMDIFKEIYSLWEQLH